MVFGMQWPCLKEISLSESQKQQALTFLTYWESTLHKSTPVILNQGQALFYQGHYPCGVYVVTSGIVELWRDGAPAETPASTVKHNHPIGMDLLAEEKPYPYTAVVSQNMSGFFISKSRLSHLIRMSKD